MKYGTASARINEDFMLIFVDLMIIHATKESGRMAPERIRVEVTGMIAALAFSGYIDRAPYTG